MLKCVKKDVSKITQLFFSHMKKLDPVKNCIDLECFKEASNAQNIRIILSNYYPIVIVLFGDEHVVAWTVNDLFKMEQFRHLNLITFHARVNNSFDFLFVHFCHFHFFVTNLILCLLLFFFYDGLRWVLLRLPFICQKMLGGSEEGEDGAYTLGNKKKKLRATISSNYIMAQRNNWQCKVTQTQTIGTLLKENDFRTLELTKLFTLFFCVLPESATYPAEFVIAVRWFSVHSVRNGKGRNWLGSVVLLFWRLNW